MKFKRWTLGLSAIGVVSLSGAISAEEHDKLSAYDDWFQELLKYANEKGFSRKSISTFDKEAWKSYFDEWFSPTDALLEDCKCGA